MLLREHFRANALEHLKGLSARLLLRNQKVDTDVRDRLQQAVSGLWVLQRGI